MSTQIKTRPAHIWRGIIEEYRDRLPVTDATPVISLREGGTPLVYGQVLSEITGCDVWIKVEGANPTGSFRDRGMTMAISVAAQEGAKAVICASTGNTLGLRRCVRGASGNGLCGARPGRQDCNGQTRPSIGSRCTLASGRR